MEELESTAIRVHLPCPDCGSHDALCEYSDGHTYCFSCKTYHSGEEGRGVGHNKKIIPIDNMKLDSLRARGITEVTCQAYSYYKVRMDGGWCQVANYFDDDGKIVGQKLRFANKIFKTRGDISTRFYGQQKWAGGGGKKLVITEGEIDCLTVSQLQGNKYPVVSIPLGVGSAKRSLRQTWTG